MRPSVIVVSLSMLAACGGLAYMHATRDEAKVTNAAVPASASVGDATRSESAQVNAASSNSAATPPASPSAAKTASSSAAEAPSIEQLMRDTESPVAKTRADAIAALANAPKDQALPALKNVLDYGDPEVDRHIALRSLHTLALNDGDSNGQIRDLMRHAIYHSDNDGVTQTAQSLLDDVEAEFSAREEQATAKKAN